MRNMEDLYGNPLARSSDSSRVFMARVYWWMVAGLALTGGVAIYVASSQTLMQAVLPLVRPLFVVELLLVLAFSFLAHKVPGPVAAGMFLLYALLNGVTFSVLFLIYSLGSIGVTFFITAGTFGALSIYATVTKKDLSSWGTFLFMGLIGIVLASVVNIFLHSSMLHFVVSCAGVVVFAGLTAYDTQKLRQLHVMSDGSAGMSLAVVGALTLYLDFINLFLSLLQLMGGRRR